VAYDEFRIFQRCEKEGESHLTVRARAKQDLLNLKELYLPAIGAIEVSEYADYRFRAGVPQEMYAEALREMALDIDYPNFKNSVSQKQGKARARLYGVVWQTLMALQMGNGA
jgi:hypothetical protein